MILDIVNKRHSIRKYINKDIDTEILFEIVKCGQNYPSRANLQPLIFILVTDKLIRDKIFDSILWGSKNKNFRNFKNSNYSPSNFIAVCVDKNIMSQGFEYEVGASVQSILLAATEHNINSLWVKSFDRKNVSSILDLSENILVDSLVCLGYSTQENKRVELTDSSEIIVKDDLNMITPKRKNEEVIYENRYNK